MLRCEQILCDDAQRFVQRDLSCIRAPPGRSAENLADLACYVSYPEGALGDRNQQISGFAQRCRTGVNIDGGPGYGSGIGFTVLRFMGADQSQVASPPVPSMP